MSSIPSSGGRVGYDVISANISSVKKYGSAITSNLCYETVLISKDEGQTVDGIPTRKECYTAQAPQSFYLKDILNAHETVRKENAAEMYEILSES